ncbi:Plasmid maintenance system antidote protein [Lentisphaera araneosa HTCC2155]|uniref:Plasmid maintenance system antidote protein n=1 Tax=Lentisphaera araneosa HTCC2155 TaxID=313628 RepID=A6DSK9_9BACT|nr:HigA family addiction module antitoxin [Lentisphaera araneosa]EDM25362.1 Plasmid maintenance system antidote protein [Lentisphaera araneosa HTCC2155]
MKTNLTNKEMCDWLVANGYPLTCHPGEILKDNLEDMNLSAYKVAKDLKLNRGTISGILNGSKKITVQTGVLLARYFDNSLAFWVNMQNGFELDFIEKSMTAELEQVPHAVAQ